MDKQTKHMYKPIAFSNVSVSEFFSGFFMPAHDRYIKYTLRNVFGKTIPSWVYETKTFLVLDCSLTNYINFTEYCKYSEVSKYCIEKFGLLNSVYDFDKLNEAISKLAFVKKMTSLNHKQSDVDNGSIKAGIFFTVNRKKLKLWFKRNHNRFLLKHTEETRTRLQAWKEQV